MFTNVLLHKDKIENNDIFIIFKTSNVAIQDIKFSNDINNTDYLYQIIEALKQVEVKTDSKLTWFTACNKPCILINIKDYSPCSIKSAADLIFSQISNINSKNISIFIEHDLIYSFDFLFKQLNYLNYSFDEFKSNINSKKIESITFFTNAELKDSLKEKVNFIGILNNGIELARNLGNTPSNVLTPKQFTEEILKVSKQYGIYSEILNEEDLKEIGANAFLAVGKGSFEKSFLASLKYQGSENFPLIALVGKGVTFDTGGISLKPSLNMEDMKYDMCGAATVLAVVQTVAQLKLPVNIVAVFALAENMPDGNSTKPGDIVKSLSGKTIEILNTDAEGRLVLADALTYTINTYKPQTVIDIATLTGACVVALGSHNSGLVGNNQDLVNNLLKAGFEADDLAWQLPLSDEYKKQIESPFADIANIGGPKGGAITAAAFLSHFTEGVSWAHLDIAGTAMPNSSGLNKSATGRPVSLIIQYLINQSKIELK